MDIQLVSYPASLEKMGFQVYVVRPEGGGDAVVSSPVGCGQAGEMRIVQEWVGTAVDGATYYVNVINNSFRQVDYGLCDSYQHRSPF